jgi:hypothetical protein
MGVLTNLIGNLFGKIQGGLASEYQRQANSAGVHPIVEESLHKSAIRNYIFDEKCYLFQIDYYKNDVKKLNKIKEDRLKHLIKYWGNEENYKLFKQKIENKENEEQIEEDIKSEEYNKKVQKEKEDFLKIQNIK